MNEDLKQLSLDILVLVNSDEFKNKEYIHEQHEMINRLLKQ